MAETHTRQAKRTPVTLKIKFKSSTLDQFIERYSVDVSHGGIFIRTKDPLAVGTQLRFEFQLKDATPLIRGDGTVVWTREHDPSRTGVAPGMGVRFDRLAEGSQQVLDKILAQKSAKAPKVKGPTFNEAPTRVAPSPLLAGLNKESSTPQGGAKPIPKFGSTAPKVDGFGGVEHTGSDATPLPSPMPFHSDADDFPEEAFEEATKVAVLDELAARSVREESDDVLDEVEPVFKEPPLTREQLAAAAPAEEKPAEEAKAKTKAKVTPVDELAQRRAKQGKPEPVEESPAPSEKKPEAAPVKAKAAAAEPEPRPTKRAKAEDEAAAATAAEVPEKSGSGIVYALLAAIVVVAGGGAYYYLTQIRGESEVADNSTTSAPAQPTPATTQSDVAPQPDVAPPPPAPPVETFSATVAATPDNATIEIVDGDEHGDSPMTFDDLDKSKPHTVRVSAPGYVTKEVPLDPASTDPVKVALDAKKRVIRIRSTPAGARVSIKGRRVPGVTPVDVPVTGRMGKKKLPVIVAMKGFRSERMSASPTDGFVDEGDLMVQELSATLQEKKVAVRTAPRTTHKVHKTADKTADKTTDKTTDKGTKPVETADKTPDKGTADKTSDTGTDGPKPDWMK